MEIKCPQQENGLYRLSRQDFEAIAESLLSEYLPESLGAAAPVDLDYLAADCLGLTVAEAYLSPRGDILGMTVFRDTLVDRLTPALERQCGQVPEGTVFVTPGQGLRGRFTLAHEIAHWLLHRPYFTGQRRNFRFRTLCRADRVGSFAFEKRTEEDWLEWQANGLAAALLMPKAPFCRAVYGVNPHFEARPVLFSGIGQKAVGKTAAALSEQFQVSRAAAEARLRHLGFVRSHGSL